MYDSNVEIAKVRWTALAIIFLVCAFFASCFGGCLVQNHYDLLLQREGVEIRNIGPTFPGDTGHRRVYKREESK